ncbi:DUF6316 family protein [Aliikangiella maris]|uniref:DUF6316 family protein n=2 Tax=Aliikangiella maris TaxID=3162458 RepID=A0ABV3MLU2_9GAMM
MIGRLNYRRSDPLNVTFHQTERMFNNELGFFYKVRGGKANGPFRSLEHAESDLTIFIKILRIEQELDTENLQLLS